MCFLFYLFEKVDPSHRHVQAMLTVVIYLNMKYSKKSASDRGVPVNLFAVFPPGVMPRFLTTVVAVCCRGAGGPMHSRTTSLFGESPGNSWCRCPDSMWRAEGLCSGVQVQVGEDGVGRPDLPRLAAQRR